MTVGKSLLYKTIMWLCLSCWAGGLFLSVSLTQAQALVVERIAGPDRFQTAVEISRAGWDRAGVVLLVRGDDFPDALAGVPLAHALQAPILLTGTGQLEPATREEIVRLGANRVIILGGEAAVSAEIAQEIHRMGVAVERVGGSTRYETAGLVARRLANYRDYRQAVIVGGGSFADALAIGPYAAREGIPILLTREDSLPLETREVTRYLESTLIVGGPSVVSPGIEDYLPAPTRIAGDDRYETAVEVILRLKLSRDKVYVTTGRTFPDALAGGVLAARDNASLLLVPGEELPLPVINLIDGSNLSNFVIIGGEGAVSSRLNLVSRQRYGTVTPIAGSPRVSLEQAQKWARERGAHQDFIQVAHIYWEIGKNLGIRPEIAYAQSAKETNFGHFTGVVSRDFNNWCGLKVFAGGPCSDPDAHSRFPDDRTGVIAHYHHLMTYAGVKVEGENLSPRSPLVRFGTAPHVEQLGARWAPDPDYGLSISRDYLAHMEITR